MRENLVTKLSRQSCHAEARAACLLRVGQVAVLPAERRLPLQQVVSAHGRETSNPNNQTQTCGLSNGLGSYRVGSSLGIAQRKVDYGELGFKRATPTFVAHLTSPS